MAVVFQLVTVPVCLAYWGVDKYGEWIALFSVFQLIRSIDSGYIGYVGNQLNIFYNTDIEKLKQHLSSSIAGIVVLIILQIILAVGVLSSSYLANLLGFKSFVGADSQGGLGLLVLVLSWAATGSYIGVIHRLMIPLGLMFQGALWSIGFQMLNFIAIIISAICRFNLLETSILFAISQAVIYLMSAIYVKLKCPSLFPWWGGAKISTGLTDLTKSTFMTISNLIQQGSTNGIILLIALIAGPVVVPIFTTVRTVSNLWLNFTGMLTTPLLPDLVRFHAQNEPQKLASTMQVYLVVVGSAMNITILIAYPILPSLYQYWTASQVPLNSPLLCFLLASVVTGNLGALMYIYLNGINSLKVVLITSIVRSVFGLGAGVFFYNQMGLSSFGFGIFLGEIITLFITTYIFYKYDLIKKGLKVPVSKLIPPISGTIFIFIYLLNSIWGLIPDFWAWIFSIASILTTFLWGWKGLSFDLQSRLLGLLKRPF